MTKPHGQFRGPQTAQMTPTRNYLSISSSGFKTLQTRMAGISYYLITNKIKCQSQQKAVIITLTWMLGTLKGTTAFHSENTDSLP